MVKPALLIFGGSGFVGRALIRRLLTSNEDRMAFGEIRLLLRDLGRRLPGIDEAGFRVFRGELPDRIPRELFPDVPHVIAHFGSAQLGADPELFRRVNVEGSRAICERSSERTVGLVYGSSLSVLGQGSQENVGEDAPLHPETSLARTRAQAETLILAHFRSIDRSAFALRPRFILGPEDLHTLPGLLSLTRRGLCPAGGRARFSVIHVDDYARIALSLLRRAANASGASPLHEQRALHVGLRRSVSLHEIQTHLCDRHRLPPPRLRFPVSETVLKLLSMIPVSPLRALITRLQLVGLSHWADVSALAERLDADTRLLLDQDPVQILNRSSGDPHP